MDVLTLHGAVWGGSRAGTRPGRVSVGPGWCLTGSSVRRSAPDRGRRSRGPRGLGRPGPGRRPCPPRLRCVPTASWPGRSVRSAISARRWRAPWCGARRERRWSPSPASSSPLRADIRPVGGARTASATASTGRDAATAPYAGWSRRASTWSSLRSSPRAGSPSRTSPRAAPSSTRPTRQASPLPATPCARPWSSAPSTPASTSCATPRPSRSRPRSSSASPRRRVPVVSTLQTLSTEASARRPWPTPGCLVAAGVPLVYGTDLGNAGTTLGPPPASSNGSPRPAWDGRAPCWRRPPAPRRTARPRRSGRRRGRGRGAYGARRAHRRPARRPDGLGASRRRRGRWARGGRVRRAGPGMSGTQPRRRAYGRPGRRRPPPHRHPRRAPVVVGGPAAALPGRCRGALSRRGPTAVRGGSRWLVPHHHRGHRRGGRCRRLAQVPRDAVGRGRSGCSSAG